MCVVEKGVARKPRGQRMAVALPATGGTSWETPFLPPLPPPSPPLAILRHTLLPAVSPAPLLPQKRRPPSPAQQVNPLHAPHRAPQALPARSHVPRQPDFASPGACRPRACLFCACKPGEAMLAWATLCVARVGCRAPRSLQACRQLCSDCAAPPAPPRPRPAPPRCCWCWRRPLPPAVRHASRHP